MHILKKMARVIESGKVLSERIFDELEKSDYNLESPVGEAEWTLLHLAASLNNRFSAKQLLEHGADINSRVSSRHRTPLSVAILSGYSFIAKLLIDEGADISVKDDNDWTLLHISISEGYYDATKLLIDAGADLSVTSGSWALSVLNKALIRDNVAIAELVLDNYKNLNDITDHELKKLNGFLAFNMKNFPKDTIRWNKIFNVINKTKYGRGR